MPNNWKTYKLGDIADIIMGQSPKSEFYNNTKSGMPFLQGNRTFGRLYPTYDTYTTDAKKIAEKGDVLFSVRAPVGDINIANKRLCIGRGLCSFRLKEGDNLFLFYLLKYYKNVIVNQESGTVFGSVNKDTLASIEVLFPESLQEQQSIASILSAIDDKIENNLAINKTLEEMAMALYKHWFVDFGPFQNGEFVESELGMIPEGWEVKRIVDFVTLTMGQSPKSEFYNFDKQGLPFHQGVTNYGDRFPEDKTYSTDGNRFAEEGDILFSVRAPVGRLNISKNKIILGRGLASLRLKEHKKNSFLFYLLKNFFTKDDIIGDGTVYGSVNKVEIENLKFIVSDHKTIASFNELIGSIDDEYLNNYNENQTLTQLRDALLPKLISGEVRLKEYS